MTATATPTVDATERVHLARAVAIAGRARGTTSPNPAVGCVLVRDGDEVGQGWTGPPGAPHAEVAALTAAGGAADGATALVTLEPCAHHGRTPPCTGALLAAGVRRVVVAHPDPNPQAAGGAEVLRANGVEVCFAPPVFRAWVAGDLEGFLTRVRTGRPHVTLKLAQTVDGHLAAPDPEQRWITGPLARRAVHRWRATVDAVLVGSGTVLADDPGLDVRDAALGDRPQPRPVVLDGRLQTPPDARVVTRGALVITRPDADEDARRALTAAGAEVIDVAVTDGGALDLDAALRSLADHGINTVLAEPGEVLGSALLAAGLVDRLVRHVAVGIGTGTPRPALDGDTTGWVTTRSGGAGDDLIWERVPADRLPAVQEVA
ncbi:MAG: bifunctional diaminohydroxyphosphoribosylaminopyrimidine deaminase/5-amino-6-(5-phosphoribosylamino)uracil reductase RibD [Nitriliruptor sp.]|uniref:bifunctional diaminohydroxyphosphoribosylaminopyrimidine deaminase/5-amino-6-(5-phosphoribosylamino)uracil reductase RibD n=1 Tax=Nitriliruptor sp. TaxID=2448056 RepID=UPI00349FF0A3